MDFNTLLNALVEVFKRNPKQAVNIIGAPGGGKTSLCFELAKRLGIPDDRIWVNHAPLADPVDYRGVPWVDNATRVTHWNPPMDLHRFRKGTGIGMIIHDDMAQASVPVKNVLGNLMLARRIDEVELDDNVIQIATGNRQEDRAGTTRNPSQVDNRMMHLELDNCIDTWSAWAMQEGIDPKLIAFLRLRPNLLHNFNPNEQRNATPRTWHMLHKSVPDSLSEDAYLAMCSGLVGDGPASEWVSARRLMTEMPNIDDILADPKNHPLPDSAKPDIVYAVCTSLAARATRDNLAAIATFVRRLPDEFTVMTMTDIVNRDKSLHHHKAFIDFAVDYQHIFGRGEE